MLQKHCKVLTEPCNKRILSVAVTRYVEYTIFLNCFLQGGVQDVAQIEKTPVSHLTKENVQKLSAKLHNAIRTFVDEDFEDDKIDIFLVLASIGQTGYELAMHGLTADDEMRQKSIDQMVLIADKILREMDATREEVKTHPSAEIMSVAHMFTLIAEFYAKRRDEQVQKMLQDEALTSVSTDGSVDRG